MPCSSTLSSPFWALLFLSPFSSLRVGRSDLLAPSPPLSPPSSFPPWVFFSGFFQASCHTTANSWNSCPPLASNKRLQEGDEAAENKQRGKKNKKKTPYGLLILFKYNHNNKIKYYSTCPPAGLLTGVWPGKPVQMFHSFLSVERCSGFSCGVCRSETFSLLNNVDVKSVVWAPSLWNSSHSLSETTFHKLLAFLRWNSCISPPSFNSSGGVSELWLPVL